MKISELETLYKELSDKLEQMKSLHRIVHALSDGLIVITTNGIISHFNLAAQDLLKLNDVSSIPFWEVFDDTFFGFSMKEALLFKQKRQRVFLSLNDETEIEVSTASTDEGIALLLHDRTEVVNLERSSQQSHHLCQIGEMAARLAHEIRNPLGGIEGFASMLRSELADPALRDMARSIVDGTKTLNSLVTSVLEYAKPLSLHFSPIDLIETLRECSVLMKEKVNFKTNLSSWPLSADKQRLKLAFLNLIHNGWEASEKKIDLIALPGEIRVTDYGCGIKPELLKKIFTPFFTTKSFGTGLGLAEAKKVIEAHGWQLEVETKVAVGTTMRVKL